MTFRKASLAVLLTFSLTACSGLDALVEEAVAWLEEARAGNVYEPLDEATLRDYESDGTDEGEAAYDELDDILVEDGNTGAFKNSSKVVLFPVDDKFVAGKIEVFDQRLYIEFKPNDAFIAIQPTENEGEFEADVNFGQTGDELIIGVNITTRQATVARKDPAGGFAQLVLAAKPRRVVGVDFDQDGKADINLYSDDVKEGGKGKGKPWEDDE